MVRVLLLLGIGALMASPAAAALAPDPKPVPPQPAPPAPVVQPVPPAPVVVSPTSAERAAATRRAARARSARLARLQAAHVKVARDAARKAIKIGRRTGVSRAAIISRTQAKAAARNPVVLLLLGWAIAFLLLASSPSSAIPWHRPARLLHMRRKAFALCGAAGLVASIIVMVL